MVQRTLLEQIIKTHLMSELLLIAESKKVKFKLSGFIIFSFLPPTSFIQVRSPSSARNVLALSRIEAIYAHICRLTPTWKSIAAKHAAKPSAECLCSTNTRMADAPRWETPRAEAQSKCRNSNFYRNSDIAERYRKKPRRWCFVRVVLFYTCANTIIISCKDEIEKV